VDNEEQKGNPEGGGKKSSEGKRFYYRNAGKIDREGERKRQKNSEGKNGVTRPEGSGNVLSVITQKRSRGNKRGRG